MLLGGLLVSTIVTLVYVPAALTLTIEIKNGVSWLLGWQRPLDQAPLTAPEEIVPPRRGEFAGGAGT